MLQKRCISMKKGQGLSLNTIIIAAIVLIVLVVLWAIFTGRMGVFSKGLDQIEKDCTSQCTAAGYATGAVKTACDSTDYSLKPVRVQGQDQFCCCAAPTATT
jgi:hypothetical protein